jgi:hypothetical protein
MPLKAEVSYPAATQQEPTRCRRHCPPVANGATVSASALALHLDCSRAYIGKLEAEGVIQRQGDGFPLDQSRVAYLRYLRRERRQSPRTQAAAAHARFFSIRRICSISVLTATPGGCPCVNRRHCRCHADRLVEHACAVRAAW